MQQCKFFKIWFLPDCKEWKCFVKPNEKGFTYDLELNDLAKVVSDTVSNIRNTVGTSSRFDRMYLKSDKWEVKGIELIGTNPVDTSEKGEKIFVSDHFGLMATFQFISQNLEETES